jgi:hypothetical protein
MPEQKLDLLQVSSGEMTEAGTPAAEVMGSEVRDSDSPGRTFHHVPYGFGCEVVPPELAVSAHSAKDETCRYPRNLCPVIYGAFHPLRHRNRSDVRALPDQIGHNPVFLPDLKVVGPQPNQLGAPETASYENCQNCPVPLPPQNIRARRAEERLALIRSQPIPDPGSQPLRTLHPSYACRQLGTQEAGIRRLISKPSNDGKPNVDCRRSEIPLFEEEPVPKHHGSIEREPRFRTVPPDELIDGVSIGFL